MKTYLRHVARNLVAAAMIALSIVSVANLLVGPTAYAQLTTQTRGPVPRIFPSQQTHYQRFTVAFNSCSYVSLVCSVKVGALPYNAFVVRIFAQTTTVWNAGTSASIGLGTVTPAVNLLASTNFTAVAAGTAQTVVAANLGVAATGNGIAQTGTNGGFDLFATITIVGALPTTGQTTFIVEYFAPNDGSCAIVPLGATAAAC